MGIALAGTLVGGTASLDASINPYVDKGTTLEITASSTLPEAGTDKIIADKTQPKITLQKWDGQVSLGITYQGLTSQGDRPLLSKNVTWTQDPKQSMEAVPLDPGEGHEDGGMEINIILNAPPASNVFSFSIDGADNLDFFYQPPLTDEEIKEGSSRPENVVGSYAVYYKNHHDHVLGEMNYATGKAYHIFRPLVTDANGATVWADLSYSNGILTVTVPQSFLDGAVYPVKVDPTFGYTTQGASDAQIYSAGGGDQEKSSRYTLPVDGTVTKLTSYVKATAACNYKASIYDDVGGDGTANNKKVIGSEAAIPSSSYTQVDSTASVSLTATDYFLGAMADGGVVTCNVAFDSSGTSYDCNTGNWVYASPPDPWACTGGSTTGTNKYSVYATYTAAAGATTPVVQLNGGNITNKGGTIKINVK